MSCPFCLWLRNYITNWLILLDKAANTLLLGNPNETVSARLGRAEKAGNGVARFLCKIIGWFSSPDHCAWAADPDPASGTLATELWNWNPSPKEA